MSGNGAAYKAAEGSRCFFRVVYWPACALQEKATKQLEWNGEQNFWPKHEFASCLAPFSTQSWKVRCSTQITRPQYVKWFCLCAQTHSTGFTWGKNIQTIDYHVPNQLVFVTSSALQTNRCNFDNVGNPQACGGIGTYKINTICMWNVHFICLPERRSQTNLEPCLSQQFHLQKNRVGSSYLATCQLLKRSVFF